jgi:hypothetical protein
MGKWWLLLNEEEKEKRGRGEGRQVLIEFKIAKGNSINNFIYI